MYIVVLDQIAAPSKIAYLILCWRSKSKNRAPLSGRGPIQKLRLAHHRPRITLQSIYQGSKYALRVMQLEPP